MPSPTNPPLQIPASVPETPNLASLSNLPVELRIQIWNELLTLNRVPRSYGYTGLPARALPSPIPSFPVPDLDRETTLPAQNAASQNNITQLHVLEADNRRRFLMARKEQDCRRRGFEWGRRVGNLGKYTRKEVQQEEEGGRLGDRLPGVVEPVKTMVTHSIIVVCKQLSAEYLQVYYRRTSFFFMIDKTNVWRGIPHFLDRGEQGESSTTNSTSSSTFQIPNFWSAPAELFHNLRHCTIYIELSDIETAIHPIRQHPNGVLNDTSFDANITKAVQNLLASMRQLRTVHIVWATAITGRIPLSIVEDLRVRISLSIPLEDVSGGTHQETSKEGELVHTRAVAMYNRDTFIDPFVLTLLAKRSLSGFQVRIGDVGGELEYKQRRGEGGKWEGC